MLRRLHKDQPASFAFTVANLAWAQGQIGKYPEGRQASAIIPLLWRAQEQEGWLTRAAIEHVADLLSMPYIRALEVATFYFMFHLAPVGTVAHIQICGTTSCMICGSEDLIKLCKERIAPKPHMVSPDGRFSWEEVECLGACTNAPMAQIGKDYYEDLTPAHLARIIDTIDAGEVAVPGPQNGRFASEPLSGLTSLVDLESGRTQHNATVQRAVDFGDGQKRIVGTEPAQPVSRAARPAARAGSRAERDMKQAAVAPSRTRAAEKRPQPVKAAESAMPVQKPAALSTPRREGPDDLKRIRGVGPKLEGVLNRLGFYHFDQIAAWTDAETDWVDENLGSFSGRVRRENWVAQAKALLKSG